MVSEIFVASSLVLWIVVLVMAFLLVGTLRQVGLIQLRLGPDPGALITREGLDRGAAAPDIRATDFQSGQPVGLGDLPDRAKLLVFVSPSCLACKDVLPHVDEVAATRARELEVRVVCTGTQEACRSLASGLKLRVPVWVEPTGAAQRDFQVEATPFAYFLSHDNVVLIRGIANDWTQFESLIEQEGTLEHDGMRFEPVNR